MNVRHVMAEAMLVALAAGSALATDQTILGKSLTVKNPATPDRRKVSVQAKEVGSPDSIVGNPTTTGGTLTIGVNGANPSMQTFLLPQGVSVQGKPFWKAVGSNGYKYKDSKGEQSAVKTVLIKKTPSGTLAIKAIVAGKLGLTVIVPPNPGTDGCATLTITGGDTYHMKYGNDGLVKNTGSRLFKVRKPQTEGLCFGVVTTTTTTTLTSFGTTSTTTSTLPYGSPSLVFMDTILGILD
jgi:hypothetical protein